jgi:hypothetical protein
MKTISLIVLLLFPVLTQSQPFTKNVPKWVDNPPKDPKKFYAVGIGTSSNAQIAERIAVLNANSKLAELVEPAVITITSKIDSVVRGNKVYIEKITVMRKSVVATLHNTRIVQRANSVKNGIYTVYVLKEMYRKEINRSVVAHIKDDKELHSAVANSDAFKSIANAAK